MLASITPLGERGRRQRFAITTSFLVGSAALAAAGVGAALGTLGSVLPLGDGARLGLLVAAASAGVLLDLGPAGLRLPTHRRQVDEAWLHRYRGWVYGAGFGAQLGVGVSTIVTTSAVYVALLAEALARGATAGAAIGATFGLLRGATVLAVARIDSPERLTAFHRAF